VAWDIDIIGEGGKAGEEQESLRAFLAFEVSTEVRDNLMKVEELLSRTRADIKFVERENLHFTVKFLGEVSEGTVEEADRRIKALSLRRMEVGVRGLGAFPDLRRPRVVWAGVAPQDLPSVSSSGQLVIDALEGIGESDDRGFHPHITLGRVRSPRNVEALTSAVRENSAKEFGRSTISALKLKSSGLTPSGPIYRDVKVYSLQ
jgi:RNA 2',3'-cyclic 3'-phosphodiesterase